MRLGFAVVKDGETFLLSMNSKIQGPNTAAAEREAVEIAKKLWPGMEVYCDYKSASGCNYIDRRHNKLAHYAAREHV